MPVIKPISDLSNKANSLSELVHKGGGLISNRVPQLTYNIPFVERTLPASRSSGMAA
jgi:hypothetical protein